MPTLELTAITLRKAIPGDVLRDGSVPGLHVRCFEGGNAFYLYYRTRGGQERRPKLGDTKVLSLENARSLARRMLSEVAAGGDPSLQKQQSIAEPTMTKLFERAYESHWCKKGNDTSAWRDEVQRVWNTNIKPRFGKMRVREPTLADIGDWHSEGHSSPVAANRALAILSKILNLAESYGWRDLNSNPCVRISRHPERQRKRFATIEELKRIGPLLDKYATTYPQAVAFIYVLVFSGSRPSAIERARRDQLTVIEHEGQRYGKLDFEGKTGSETVYLPPAAMACIDRLNRTDELLIGIKMPRKLWYKIRKEAGCEDLWMRDLRRTFATVGFSAGHSMQTISELFNHKSVQTTKIYATLVDDSKRETADMIAGRMEQLLRAG